MFFVVFLMPAQSQSRILDAEVRFVAHTSTIKELLTALGEAGGFTFSYGKEVPVHRRITVTDEKKTIREHLDSMFSGDSLDYVEKGNKILIVPASHVPSRSMPLQTVRGRILDQDSKSPLIGVNVLIGSDGPEKGTITDENGYFRFENVPVGRHGIQCTYIGYKPIDIPNLVVGSGKESILKVEMEESAIEISEVTITNLSDQAKPINSLAVVSGRSFSAYEVENYPGSISDISRAAVSFPGVISPNDGQNHLVIRGNSPKGLQWRLEGLEIPNLNHFSDIGASGGGVNVISNNMLAGSDFLTSAFPAEYGNALSGVFDLRLNAGNNEKHEQTIQIGMIGSEVQVEGPIHRASNTTYTAQYRYSTLKIVEKMGAEMQSVPDFQDLSFKIYHPSKKAGVFSIFGIGGLSHETGYSGYEMNSDMFTAGFSNSLTVNPKTFVRTILALSGRSYTWDSETNIGSGELPIDRIWRTNILDYTAKGSVILSRKINPRHKIKAGVIYEMAWNDSHMSWHSDTLYNRYSDPGNPDYQNLVYGHTWVDTVMAAGTLQAFGTWNYRIGDNLTFNTGLHFIQFYLSNKYSIEPRFGLQWTLAPRHTLSAGFGIHSRKESMTLYAGRKYLSDESYLIPNLDLELSKARHYVLGYDFRTTNLLNLKTEVYYQDLYDTPAYPFPPYFTTLNYDFGFEGNVLTNYGSGYNTGIEVSVDKYISNGFHFLWNGTLYESMYKDKLGDWHHTKYNSGHASNGLIGKEFKLGKGKQHTFSINSRYILAGGMRYLPIDEEASQASGSTIRPLDDGFSGQYPSYFRIDLLLKFRRNRPGYTGEWSLDLLNVTNRKNVRYDYWDNSSNSIQYEYQNPFIPVLSYRIQF